MSKFVKPLLPFGVNAETEHRCPIQTLAEFEGAGILPPFELSADAALRKREIEQGNDPADQAIRRRTYADPDPIKTHGGPGPVLMPMLPPGVTGR